MILRGYSIGGDGSAKEFNLGDSKRHFSRPALRMHLKTAPTFFMSCSVVLAAIPISSCIGRIDLL